jgi:two-component system OmpR family response regulator
MLFCALGAGVLLSAAADEIEIKGSASTAVAIKATFLICIFNPFLPWDKYQPRLCESSVKTPLKQILLPCTLAIYAQTCEASTMAELILIVDDEAGVRELLGDALRIAGFETATAQDGMSALTAIRTKKPDLLIIDINMPLMDGFELVERLRSTGDNTPALMLSARADRIDVTRGLTLGADDYVTKPFGLEELLLRVKAILRRSQISQAGAADLRCGPINILESSHTVLFNEESIDLSPTEFRLLQVLVENKNRVLSKSLLLDEVWGITFESESTVADTYISYLRKKLHRDGFEGIKTVRGVGFVIQEPK